jgi:tight adherence protein C
MLDLLIDKLHDTRFLAMCLAAIAAIATVVTLTMPLLAGDTLDKRMKAVALEREKMRQRERERMARTEKVALRTSPKAYMQTVVEQFNLTKWVGQEAAREKLMQAGYRGQGPYVAFLFFRMVVPLVMLVGSLIYVFLILKLDQPTSIKSGLCLIATWLGMQLPFLFLKNKIQHRKLSIIRAFPDALDLLLICVESGMSIEAAFRRVSEEIGSQSIALCEELTLTTAELSYLPDRRQTLRVMSQENRDMRMSEAEKKAAALPPKLTVPMIVFFLPVLFVVILGPAAIKAMAAFN